MSDSAESTAVMRRCDGGSDGYGDKPWRDEDLLRELYVEEEMSLNDIAEEFDCAQSTVRNWMERHDIPTRSISEALDLMGDPVPFWTRTRGHETWCASFGDRSNAFVYVHRLAAVAWYGVEETMEADIVHHENEIPWDNREENISLMGSIGDHMKQHRKFVGVDRLRIAELYEDGDMSSYDLSDWLDFDICPESVVAVHHQMFGGEAGA